MNIAEVESNSERYMVLSSTDTAEFLTIRVKLKPPCYFIRDTTITSSISSQYYIIGTYRDSDIYNLLLINTFPDS